jgi:hypothetical protein
MTVNLKFEVLLYDLWIPRGGFGWRKDPVRVQARLDHAEETGASWLLQIPE